jgi:hypothetical protein
MIRGIGPAYAKKLMGSFGEKVFEIIEPSPSRLRSIVLLNGRLHQHGQAGAVKAAAVVMRCYERIDSRPHRSARTRDNRLSVSDCG